MICSSPVKGIDVYIAIREEMVIDREIIIYKHADCSQVHQHIYIKLRQTFHWLRSDQEDQLPVKLLVSYLEIKLLLV